MFVIDIASIFFASSISSGPGATAISILGCFVLIILIKSLKYGHFLWESWGEQKGKSNINFPAKYLLTILSTLILDQEKSGLKV